jgi:hypothetical protein
MNDDYVPTVTFIIGLALGVLFVCAINLGYIPYKTSITIDERCKDLNLMHYDSKTDSMIYNDDIKCDKWTFKYLKDGTMK